MTDRRGLDVVPAEQRHKVLAEARIRWQNRACLAVVQARWDDAVYAVQQAKEAEEAAEGLDLEGGA